MLGVLAAPATELIQGQTLRIIFLVLFSGVIPFSAITASERNNYAGFTLFLWHGRRSTPV